MAQQFLQVANQGPRPALHEVPSANNSVCSASQATEKTRLVRDAHVPNPRSGTTVFDAEFGPPVVLDREKPPPVEWDPFFGPPVVKGQGGKSWGRSNEGVNLLHNARPRPPTYRNASGGDPTEAKALG